MPRLLAIPFFHRNRPDSFERVPHTHAPFRVWTRSFGISLHGITKGSECGLWVGSFRPCPCFSE